MGIMGDILDVTPMAVIMESLYLHCKANLSHYAVLDKCEKLVKLGLVNPSKMTEISLFDN